MRHAAFLLGLAFLLAPVPVFAQLPPPKPLPEPMPTAAPAKLPEKPPAADVAPPPATDVAPEPPRASTTPSANPSANPSVPTRDRDLAWDRGYLDARNELMTGSFAAAAGHFTELAGSAHNAADRALATEQAALATEWAKRGLAFVRREDLGESTLSAKAVDVRTTDEIVVLYSNAILFGLGTGLWIDEVSQPQSQAGIIFPPLLGAGAAVGTVALLDSGRGLRYGVPQSIVSGMYVGLEEGIAFTAWNSTRQDDHQMSGQAAATLLWTTSAAGAVAGGILGDKLGTTPGRAAFVGSTALWTGLVTGLTASTFDTGRQPGGAAMALGLVGVNAGLVGGLLSASSVSPSVARVRILDLGGLGGFLVSEGLYLGLTKDSSAQAATGLAALGMAGGLTIAWFATEGMEPDRLLPREPSSASPRASSPLANMSPTLMPVRGGGMIGLQGQLF